MKGEVQGLVVKKEVQWLVNEEVQWLVNGEAQVSVKDEVHLQMKGKVQGLIKEKVQWLVNKELQWLVEDRYNASSRKRCKGLRRGIYFILLIFVFWHLSLLLGSWSEDICII